jgi:two-component system NtrC family sensor kinase
MGLLSRLKIRWKLVVMVLPLVVIPIVIVGSVVGYLANEHAYRGITQTSKDDLDHMARFTLDLFASHHRQFQVYKEDKQRTIHRDLATLVNFAYSLLESEESQRRAGRLTAAEARAEARKAIQKISIGETGYIYAMTSGGRLTVHPAREGDVIIDARDDDGREFIREMCEAAVRSELGAVLYIVYPWKNAILGDAHPRRKVVAYRYFPAWDWIVAAGTYLDETYEDERFERDAFAALKDQVQAKRVGRTGYIYAMTVDGVMTIHAFREGENLWDQVDDAGRYFIREMCEKKEGWIRYPWRNEGELAPRMKIVRYLHFEPWDWIVAVGSYEDEFYHEADKISGRIFWHMFGLTIAVGLIAVVLVVSVSRFLTNPIQRMTEVMRDVRQGRLEARMGMPPGDELGELGDAFDAMTEVLKRNRELENSLAHQDRMASLGVLASGVAHEINNPLGVILGYAGHLEGKLDPADPNHRYIQDIKRESKRCKKIVQDLLSYARVPKPSLEETDINALLDQIVDFASNHVDMRNVKVQKVFAPDLPTAAVDGDQIRQVAINLILNAGGAMPRGGTLTVETRAEGEKTLCMSFADTGVGIPEDRREKIFEPFFTTKGKGTGLGLAITRQIIEQHGGSIEVESEVGAGSTIRVRLPLQRDAF